MQINQEPASISEYEIIANKLLPQGARGYYASGANDMISLKENRIAFSRLCIIPRILVGVQNIDTSTTVLGERVQSPIAIAPTARHKMAHNDGECGTAKAAFRHGNTLMVLSTTSNNSLEEVADCSPNGLRWFQLYMYKDLSISVDLIRRAEAAGFKAIVITCDTPALGRREADIKNSFQLPKNLTLGNFNFTEKSKNSTLFSDNQGTIVSYCAELVQCPRTWDDLKWLRHQTKLPIVAKGVLTSHDAAKAIDYGVDAVWVSNHGGRQLDTVPATIEVLHDVFEACQGKVEVYLDGGITRGSDAFKALAMGARAVFIGRPVLWGLACSGEEGVYNVLGILNSELREAMQIAGCTSVKVP